MPGPAVRRTGHAPGADRVELAIGEHVLGAARSVQLLVRLEGELPVGAEPGPGPVQVDPAGLLHQDRPGPVVLRQRAQRLGLLLAAAVLAAAPGRHPGSVRPARADQRLRTVPHGGHHPEQQRRGGRTHDHPQAVPRPRPRSTGAVGRHDSPER
ncbi:hypothetical protein [Kitasatospora griseola]|uniref:hypothetical protein n=1 Tax=Kitasatospora griseola TaxID=2064 RepID=UPI003664C136